jgi:hypothetical protein
MYAKDFATQALDMVPRSSPRAEIARASSDSDSIQTISKKVSPDAFNAATNLSPPRSSYRCLR